MGACCRGGSHRNERVSMRDRGSQTQEGCRSPGGSARVGGKLPEGRWSQGGMTNQDDTAKRRLPRPRCWTPGQGRWRDPEAPGRGSASWRNEELDRGPAGSSLDSEHLSELRGDFPRLSGAKGLDCGHMIHGKKAKKAPESSIRLSTNKTTPTLRASPKLSKCLCLCVCVCTHACECAGVGG